MSASGTPLHMAGGPTRQSMLANALLASHDNGGLRDWVAGLYNTDAEFHQAIVMLARMLPVWIVGLASEAELGAQDRAARIKAAEQPGSRQGLIGIEITKDGPGC